MSSQPQPAAGSQKRPREDYPYQTNNNNNAPNNPQQQQQQQAQQQQPVSKKLNTGNTSNTTNSNTPMPKVQDALGYLEKVKNRFSKEPTVYNAFLEIMKDFKSQNIDTEGVIKRVKTLFRGNRSLILGFNQFLPPGFKIEVDASDLQASAAAGNNNNYQGSVQSTHNTNNSHNHPHSSQQSSHSQQQSQSHSTHHPHSVTTATIAAPPAAAAASSSSSTKPPKPTIEFNHAVQYVAKIKHRFRSQPEIYAEFLDILHDYQAKRTIDEVYQRVQKLFGGQPDLLDEFKYFLPDHKQQQLATTGSLGSNNKSNKSNQLLNNSMNAHNKSSSSKSKSSKSSKSSSSNNNNNNQNQSSSSDKHRSKDKKSRSNKDKDNSNNSSSKSTSNTKSNQSQSITPVTPLPNNTRYELKSRQRIITYPAGSDRELSMFERLKQFCTIDEWLQVLKSINLFSNEIITRPELVRMLEDLLSDRPGAIEQLDRFKSTIGFDEWEEKQLLTNLATNYYSFISSVDFNTCPQVTPSYRELPSIITIPHSTGRSILCDSVLNDTLISIPTGSEDFSFKSTRKNIYEENLFKVEDERFELDMIIENNSSCIRVLEPLAEQAANMSPEQAKKLRLGENIDILHIRAIARIYAESGYEMVELLQKNPAVASKVILDRLRQKDDEWRRVRLEMKNVWRKITEQNYQRSLDHRSFYFKQEDKKRRSPKALIAELREVHQQVFGIKLDGESSSTTALLDSNGNKIDSDSLYASLSSAGEESVMLRQIRQGHSTESFYSYCMNFKYQDPAIHEQIYSIVCRVAKNTLSSEIEQMKLQQYFIGFVHQFFNYQLSSQLKAEAEELINRVNARQAQEAADKAAGIIGSTVDSIGLDNAAASAMIDAFTSAPIESTNNNTAGTVDDDGDDIDPLNDDPSATARNPNNTNQRQRNRRGRGGKPASSRRRPTRNRPLKPSGIGPGGDLEEVDDDLDAADLEPEVEENKKSRMGFNSKDATVADDDIDDSTGLNNNNSTALSSSTATGTAAGTDSNSRLSNNLSNNKSTSSAPTIIEIAARIASISSNSIDSNNSLPRVKPIRVQMDTWSLEEKLHPVRRHTRPSKLFFGSNAFYVFFRLHQFLYERLSTAKQLANKTRRTSSKKKVPVTADEREKKFQELLNELLDVGMEPNRFEDECRNLLGAASYVLFTIDKLIAQLVKQSLALVNSETSLQLLCLYQYQLLCAKTAPINNSERSAQLCRMYHSNCSSILAEDNCCQIEYFIDSGELGIGLIEALAAPEPKHHSEEWKHYMEQLLHQPAKLNKSALNYLPRNVRKYAAAANNQSTLTVSPQNIQSNKPSTGGKGKGKSAAVNSVNPVTTVSNPSLTESDLDLLRLKSLRSSIYHYGLESKICLRSYKVQYVEDTEDVFIRRKKRITSTAIIEKILSARKRNNSKRAEIFTQWYSRRFHQLFPTYEAEQAALLANQQQSQAQTLAEAVNAVEADTDQMEESIDAAAALTDAVNALDSVEQGSDVADDVDNDAEAEVEGDEAEAEAEVEAEREDLTSDDGENPEGIEPEAEVEAEADPDNESELDGDDDNNEPEREPEIEPEQDQDNTMNE